MNFALAVIIIFVLFKLLQDKQIKEKIFGRKRSNGIDVEEWRKQDEERKQVYEYLKDRFN